MSAPAAGPRRRAAKRTWSFSAVHEMSIAVNVLEQVLAHAGEQGAERVAEVELAIGRMQMVVPEALAMSWEAVRTESIAAGAELKMVEVPALAECRRCGRRFEPDVDYSFACPECGQADVRIIDGNEIILRSVVLELAESADAT